jgi:hypothetical protein
VAITQIIDMPSLLFSIRSNWLINNRFW